MFGDWIRPDLALNFLVFCGLLLASLLLRPKRLLSRATWEWIVDLLGLGVQGLLVPLLQVVGVVAVLQWAVPNGQGSVSLDPWVAAFCAFVGVDALYYWNHRFLHSKLAWPVHQVHHSTERMDVLVTSRNTLWSSAFVVYLWAHGAALFFLDDATGWIWGATITACLDLWRHSGFQPSDFIAGILRPFLVLPNDHALHHSTANADCNFGANLCCWDRLFGTWEVASEAPQDLGIPTGLELGRTLFWPFRGKA